MMGGGRKTGEGEGGRSGKKETRGDRRKERGMRERIERNKSGWRREEI